MKVIYVAGPYRAATIHGVLENIREAEHVAIDVWKTGNIAICPHMNSAFFDGLVPDEVFLAGTLELLKRSDGVVLVKNWHHSSGTIMELEFCLREEKPVFFNARDLLRCVSVGPDLLRNMIESAKTMRQNLNK